MLEIRSELWYNSNNSAVGSLVSVPLVIVVSSSSKVQCDFDGKANAILRSHGWEPIIIELKRCMNISRPCIDIYKMVCVNTIIMFDHGASSLLIPLKQTNT